MSTIEPRNITVITPENKFSINCERVPPAREPRGYGEKPILESDFLWETRTGCKLNNPALLEKPFGRERPKWMTNEWINLFLEKARTASEYSYAPTTGRKIGACVFSAPQKFTTGCLIENRDPAVSMCAERVAMTTVVSEGISRTNGGGALAIAVWYDHNPQTKLQSNNGIEPFPCGSCRQVLSEFSPNIWVVTGSPEHRLPRIYPNLNEQFPNHNSRAQPTRTTALPTTQHSARKNCLD